MNKERGPRFSSLLSMFGLESRLICMEEKVDDNTLPW